jgi:tRNA 5-methylaminomethyl-2-thiouridine biosynthesis bifunctional protein
MKANTPWRPARAAAVSWNDDIPFATKFDDVYYSREDGAGESRHVFLAGNGLPGRWDNHRQGPFMIAETGFGTGLNFLLTWKAWRGHSGHRPRLHYLSIEKFPLTPGDLSRALARWPELGDLSEQLLAQYPGLLPGQHRLLLENGSVVLDLWWLDVNTALEDIGSHQYPLIDAWYLDGFAPSRNESMWNDSVLQAVGRLSRPGATFATFTAAGAVRRSLAAAGFEVEKTPGFGRKRECLRGSLCALPVPEVAVGGSNWDLPSEREAVPASALVIGAGLAGCSVAQSLARRGIAVTLLDQGGLAAGASANEQGVLYTRLSRKHAPMTDFALQSFRFASNLYRQLFASGALIQGVDGRLCGCFQRSSNSDDMAALAEPLSVVPELARVVDAAAANQLTGLQQSAGGYWLPASGWMHPPGVCRALARHDNITLLENCGPISLEAVTCGWRALARGRVLAEADCAIIAAGTASSSLAGLDWLPLRAIRGQTTSLPLTPVTRTLRAVFCHEGYIAPARKGHHCIGATFDLTEKQLEARPQDNLKNLAKLSEAVPAWADELAAMNPDGMTARVGFRCATPDYLPLVGQLPIREAFLQDFAGLRKNARRTIACRGQYMPGLYASTGHGSRGLTSTPLAAELLASMICHEPLPLERALCRALSPARFLIRDLGRNRI